MESVLGKGPLCKNVYFLQCNSSGDIVTGQTGQPLCQELLINMGVPGVRLQFMPTGQGCPSPLTLMGCHPGWEDYFDLGESVAEMTQHLMREDRQLEGVTLEAESSMMSKS